MSEKKIPVIIDTDPGVDDVLAIILAAASDKLDIVGICPVDGNVQAEYTHRNALDLVEFLKKDIPVAKGSFDQLVQRHGKYARCHGATGLGAVTLPRSNKDFHELAAWDFIYEKAKEYGGELEIIAVGPLTNIARALIVHDDLPQYIKRITIMGGSIERGNVTPYAEFNFWVDAPAAKVVFQSGIPLVMAGLNVTMKTGIAFDFIENLAKSSNSRIANLFNEFINSYSDAQVNREGDRSSVVHDAIAVAYVINPDGCTTEDYNITINTDRYLHGEWARSIPSKEGEMNCTVITDIDMDYYRSLYVNAVEHFKDLE
ncbi:MAG: nucleoside hydrolase [Oscillospiraceae bacterium]|nr:nucleoside hydrolase [Oscillospiraceae bacterium]